MMAFRPRAYLKTAAMSATSYIGDSPLFLMDYGLRFLRVVILLALWRVILGDRGPVEGLTLSAVLTYALIAEVFAEQLTARTELTNDLWQGTIAMRFLQPLAIVGQFAAEMAGRWAIGLALFSLPLLLVAPLLGVDPRPASLAAGAFFVLSLALAVVVGLAVEFIFGALSVVFSQNAYVTELTRTAVGTILSGAIVPLALLPWGLGEIFTWLPFAAMASAPLRIYTGTGEPLPLLLLQLGWAVALWPLAGWLWRIYRERLAFYGG